MAALLLVGLVLDGSHGDLRNRFVRLKETPQDRPGILGEAERLVFVQDDSPQLVGTHTDVLENADFGHFCRKIRWTNVRAKIRWTTTLLLAFLRREFLYSKV